MLLLFTLQEVAEQVKLPKEALQKYLDTFHLECFILEGETYLTQAQVKELVKQLHRAIKTFQFLQDAEEKNYSISLYNEDEFLKSGLLLKDYLKDHAIKIEKE